MIIGMREFAQSWVMKIVLGGIVVTFIGAFGVVRLSATKQVLAKVGSDEILLLDYNRQYQRALDDLRQRFPENTDTVANQLNLRGQVFDRLVRRNLFLRAARAAGLMVTDEEVSDAVTNRPHFQVVGRFDFATYQAILRQNGLTPESFEEGLREDLLVEKYQRTLVAGVVISQPEIDLRYRIENERVEVEFIYVDPEWFRGKVRSDREAEKAYYDEHKAEFNQPAQFKIRYFILSTGGLEGAVKVPARAIGRYYERNRETEFTTPKKVRASHILKQFSQDTSPEQVAQYQLELEKILAKARAGESFAVLAKKHSDDFTKDRGGDLGEFQREDMLAEFSNAAFALKEGEISNIVRTAFGFHIIKVTRVVPARQISFGEARPRIEENLRVQRAERKLTLELERLPFRIESEGIETVAAEFSAGVETSGWFDGAATLSDLGSTGPLYSQVRNLEVLTAGVLRRNPVQGHVFYQILEKKEAFLRPFEGVRPRLTERVREERRSTEALKTARAAYQEIKSLKDFMAFAGRHGAKRETTAFTSVERVVPNLGINREFQTAGFQLSEEKRFGLSIQDKTAHLLSLKKRFSPPKEEEAQIKARIAARLESGWRQYLIGKEIERLKETIKVEVLAPEFIASS